MLVFRGYKINARNTPEIDGWNLQITQLEEDNHLQPKPPYYVPNVHFPGV